MLKWLKLQQNNSNDAIQCSIQMFEQKECIYRVVESVYILRINIGAFAIQCKGKGLDE